MDRSLVLGPQEDCPTTVGSASKTFSQATVVRLYNSNMDLLNSLLSLIQISKVLVL